MKFKNQSKLMRTTRYKSQLTQQDMAVFMGTDSAQQVSNIERGESPIPQKYWKKLSRLSGKDELLKALVDDLKDEFKGELK